jgi:SNF2 family DNA or RNA helicase
MIYFPWPANNKFYFLFFLDFNFEPSNFCCCTLFTREAKFHILITSYQLLVADEKYFRRVKWQYMVLDEAQAIKSANRFALLSFSGVHKWMSLIISRSLFLRDI